MKRIIKHAISVILAVVIFTGALPIGGLTDFTIKSKAVTTEKTIEECTVGDIICFGSYPQSKVTETSIIAALDSMSKTWISYEYYSGTADGYSSANPNERENGNMVSSDYMKYCDLSYDGKKYRAVTFSEYRPSFTGYTPSTSRTYQDDNGYYTDNVYYFNYEPLTWRILDPSDGYVMCTRAIDAQAYQNYVYKRSGSDAYNSKSCANYASDWATSSLREWLNNDFYNTAFLLSEKRQIDVTYNENKNLSSSQSKYDSINTSDRIFLLSISDIINPLYGFNSKDTRTDEARQKESTDYAKCQGCSTNIFFWWLRSPYGSLSAAEVRDNGLVRSPDSKNCFYGNVSETYNGIVPAFELKPKSIVNIYDNCLSADITFDSEKYYFNNGNFYDENGSKVDSVSGTIDISNISENGQDVNDVAAEISVPEGFTAVTNPISVGTIGSGETVSVDFTFVPNENFDIDNSENILNESVTANISSLNAESVYSTKEFKIEKITSNIIADVKLDYPIYKIINNRLYSPDRKKLNYITADVTLLNCIQNNTVPQIPINVELNGLFSDNETDEQGLRFENNQKTHSEKFVLNFGEKKVIKIKIYVDESFLDSQFKGSSKNREKFLYFDITADDENINLESEIPFQYQLNDEKDFLGFTNQYQHFSSNEKEKYRISETTMSKIKNSSYHWYKIFKTKCDAKWNGSCLGMASVVSAMNNGIISPADFGSDTAITIKDPLSNALFGDCINTLFMAQFTEDYKKNVETGGQEALLKELVDAVNAIPQTGFCPVICIRGPVGFLKSGRHALTAFNIKDDGGRYVVYVYDPNDPKVRELYIDKNFKSMTYNVHDDTGNVSGTYDEIVGVITADKNRFADINYFAPDFFGNTVTALRKLNIPKNGSVYASSFFEGSLTVKDSAGKTAVISSDGTVSGNLDINPEAACADAGTDIAIFTYILNPNETYTFSCTGQKYCVSLDSGDFISSAKVSNNIGSEIMISSGNICVQKDPAEDCTVSLCSNSLFADTNLYSADISLGNSSMSNFSISKDGIIVNSDTLSSLSANADRYTLEEIVTDKISFKSLDNSKSVILCNSKDNNHGLYFKEYDLPKIDESEKYIYGDALTNLMSQRRIITDNNDLLLIEKTDDVIGTDRRIALTKDGIPISMYVIVIFGDVNGDGWYDGMDSMIVSCLANGMLTKDDVGEAVYMAADCNHDGTIDQLDVDLLQQAGLLLANIDQSKSEAELLATSSAYVEYLNLIDQTVETETTEVVEEEPVGPGNTFNFFETLIAFIKEIIVIIEAALAVIW